MNCQKCKCWEEMYERSENDRRALAAELSGADAVIKNLKARTNVQTTTEPNKPMTTVIYHSADFDGIFCREIARKFLGTDNVEYIGWDFGDAPLPVPEGTIYILDLPVDRVFGLKFGPDAPTPSDQFAPVLKQVIWIDHHGSSIASHPKYLPGYRIDGVAACRLAWQWFATSQHNEQHRTNEALWITLPRKDEFIARTVSEPLSVRLAGEYDVWDKRDERAEVFQFGLRSQALGESMWDLMLSGPNSDEGDKRGAAEMTVDALLENGAMLQRYQQGIDASVVKFRSFVMEFAGLKFLALNTARCNSLTFAAKDVAETGHDALCGFFWTGQTWKVSLYHARHRKDVDLSKIAVKHGGGGHKGACGFEAKTLAWL